MLKVFHNKRSPYVLVFSVPMSSKARDEPDEALVDFKQILMHVSHDIISASAHACFCMCCTIRYSITRVSVFVLPRAGTVCSLVVFLGGAVLGVSNAPQTMPGTARARCDL